MKLTKKQVMEAVRCDSVSASKGVFTVRDAFFYTHGKTEHDLIRKVKAAYPNAVIINYGEKWKPFRGGDSVAQGSHWFVVFNPEATNG